MKKMLKWISICVVTILLLPLLLVALLYVPPVQNWAVQKVAAIASEKMGMTVTVGEVSLKWPLDLQLNDFLAIHEGDTLADVRTMVLDVKLKPLFDKRVVINELSLNDAKLNTNGFISDLRVKGIVGDLWLSSRGIDLDRETAEVNGARLADANLDIALSDTAAVDTTTSDVKWRINADSLTISRTQLSIHLAGDSTHIGAYLGQAVAREADIDLENSIYRVGTLDLHEGRVSEVADVQDIRLGVDSIYYGPLGTSFYVRRASLKEAQTGLQLTELCGGVKLDTAFSHIQMPAMVLRTTDSDVEAEVDMDFSVLDSLNPGKARVRLNAQIGKQDIVRFGSSLPQQMLRQWPNHPLTVKGSVNGNMERMELTGLDIQLPTAFHLKTDGTLHHVTDMDRLQADLNVDGEMLGMDFVKPLLPASVVIPPSTLKGTVKANGKSYTADLTARQGEGTVALKGHYNGVTERYAADISVRRLNIHHFMPRDSIYTVTADAKVEGRGLDFLSPHSTLTADASIQQLRYGHMNIDNVKGQATLKDGHALAELTGSNELFDGTVSIDAQLGKKQISAAVTTDLQLVDLYRLRLTNEPLTIGVRGTVNLTSDTKQSHEVSGRLGSLYIQDESATYHPENLDIYLKTDADTTVARLQSGNLTVKADISGGYERLLSQLSTLGDSVVAQYRQKRIDQPAIRRLLPVMRLYATSGNDNPLAAILKTSNIDFKEMFIDLTTSPETGVNGDAYIYSLNYDSTRIDTISLHLRQKGDRLTYQGQVRNNKHNPQMVFNALFDGHLHEHGALAGLRFYDNRGLLGVRLGATAEMEDDGIRFRLMPERPTIGYKEFNLNKDNYIFLGSNKRIQAKIDLVADDRTGLKIYTDDSSSDDNLQDLTVSVNRLDLGELTSAMPFLPQITGKLNGDYHIVQNKQENISVVSDMAIEQMTFEGSPIGNISAEFDYLMKDGDDEHQTATSHIIEARLMLDDEEFGLLSGHLTPSPSPNGETNIDATFTMTRFPLSMANGFVPDQLIGLEGYAEGSLAIKGTTSRPQVDGEVYVEDAYLVSHPYGIRMRFDNDPVRIVNSKLLLENFGLYAYNEEPLNMKGEIDFSNTERIMMDIQMRARDMLLINARQEPKSIAFGKAYVNFFARLQGPIEALNMRGRLDVLGSTDMVYMLLDSPLSTDNRLDELVKFTDFTDSTETVVTRPTPSGLNVDLTINVSTGSHVLCNLNLDQTNYIDLNGGGDLRMRYNSEGIELKGRYTLSSGEMKYSLPIIPLKTFTISDGSYVEFTGDPMNPRLNITAIEHTKAVVRDQNGGSRSVAFDCGVKITRTLNDMGLQFIIDAPEDQTISGELATMSDEERGKIAVTMLTTGMYLANGDTNGFSMNSALSAFLQGEINQIAGSALKTLDVQVGIDNTTDASGQMHTDYSFRFAKRFMNNRLRLQIGGKVTSGDNAAMGQQQSFFDNVTMEYRLNQEATKNLKLFYKQNVYDWLEGYTGEYGVGFLWRRKLDKLFGKEERVEPRVTTNGERERRTVVRESSEEKGVTNDDKSSEEKGETKNDEK